MGGLAQPGVTRLIRSNQWYQGVILISFRKTFTFAGLVSEPCIRRSSPAPAGNDGSVSGGLWPRESEFKYLPALVRFPPC